MKKALLLTLAIIISLGCFGQESASGSPNFRKNDILIDPFWIIGGLALNASYERILSEDSGLGVNGIFGLGNDLEDFTQVSPYYRAYFGSKYASGFFVEGFVPITVQRESEWESSLDEGTRSKNFTTGGLGFGLGGKWVAKKKFVFELNVGIARKIIGDRGSDDPVTGKGMIGIGFAF